MIHRFAPGLYERVRTLFRPLLFHLASAAVLDGICPGRVFVDDPERPKAAFIVSPEGCYLVGDPWIAWFNRAFNQALGTGELFDGDVRVLFLVVNQRAGETS